MNDKFILFYVKNDVAYPVKMSQEEFETLQIFIPGIFNNKEVTVIGQPIGKIRDLVKEK